MKIISGKGGSEENWDMAVVFYRLEHRLKVSQKI